MAIVFGRPYDRARLEPGAGVTLLDRDGGILRRAGAGAHWTPLDGIAPDLVKATLASEDHRFYDHHGVDVWGLTRAAWLDLRGGRMAFGGSTITMQLVRMVEPGPRGLSRKLRQIVDAVRIERALSKPAILEQYLNRAYYGNRATGAQAAAQVYFGKPAAELSLGEAALLAVIPRAPEAYDPFRQREAALARRAHVLSLMVKRGFISAEEARAAAAEPLALKRTPAPFQAPHFCDHVLFELAAQGASGTVRTTLDRPLQERLEAATQDHLRTLFGQHVTNAGIVVLDNDSGAVRALIGSSSYSDAQVDIVLARRSPGSALKPFLYALALERGDGPASVAYDAVRPELHVGRAHNADGKQRGAVRYRDALGSSLNLAALDLVTRRVGTQTFLDRLAQAGLLRPGTTGSPGVVLGAASVRPLDLAAAFAAFARDGTFHPWHDRAGAERPAERLFSPQVAFLVADMLADPAARRPVFGEDLPLDLPFRLLAKTGTSAGFADNVTVGATREYTVLAWAGNFDGSPMHGVLAMRGAAPLVRAAFLTLRERGPLTLPERPDRIEEAAVCPLSGLRPGPYCQARKRDLFVAGTAPGRTCDWHRAGGAIQWPSELRAWAASKNDRAPLARSE
ncbi:MAG TPA: transglycosylase domain-containing protein [Polyangia bacterium]|nr:transglycosylase domain-containing protein [Polyangia bacterium]